MPGPDFWVYQLQNGELNQTLWFVSLLVSSILLEKQNKAKTLPPVRNMFVVSRKPTDRSVRVLVASLTQSYLFFLYL